MQERSTKKKKTPAGFIVVMLIEVASMASLLIHRGSLLNEARRNENRKQAEELRQLEEKVVSVSEEGAEQIVEDYRLASHVFSHRVVQGSYEHSFKAYDEAISVGSHNIEQDLVISSDGVLFISHDLNASAMTGIYALYSSMIAEDIDRLKTYAGYKVLRLSEVFDRYGRSINYIIELKTADSTPVSAFGNIVDEYGYKDIITVQSVNTDVLKTLDEKYPDMPKLFVCKSQQSFYDSLEMPYVDIISVSIDRGLMTESNCEAAHESGKQFSAWTLSMESSIRKAIDMNVDIYFTNDTPLALSLESEYGLKVRGQSEESEH